jgi:hypothetical protein
VNLGAELSVITILLPFKDRKTGRRVGGSEEGK